MLPGVTVYDAVFEKVVSPPASFAASVPDVTLLQVMAARTVSGAVASRTVRTARFGPHAKSRKTRFRRERAVREDGTRKQPKRQEFPRSTAYLDGVSECINDDFPASHSFLCSESEK